MYTQQPAPSRSPVVKGRHGVEEVGDETRSRVHPRVRCADISRRVPDGDHHATLRESRNDLNEAKHAELKGEGFRYLMQVILVRRSALEGYIRKEFNRRNIPLICIQMKPLAHLARARQIKRTPELTRCRPHALTSSHALASSGASVTIRTSPLHQSRGPYVAFSEANPSTAYNNMHTRTHTHTRTQREAEEFNWSYYASLSI